MQKGQHLSPGSSNRAVAGWWKRGRYWLACDLQQDAKQGSKSSSLPLQVKTINSTHPASSDWIRIQSQQIQVEEKGNKVNEVHKSRIKSSGIATALSTHRAYTVNKQVPISKCCWTHRYLFRISPLMDCGSQELGQKSRTIQASNIPCEVVSGAPLQLWCCLVNPYCPPCPPGVLPWAGTLGTPQWARLSHQPFCACRKDTFITPWLLLNTLFLTFYFPNHLLY